MAERLRGYRAGDGNRLRSPAVAVNVLGDLARSPDVVAMADLA